MPITKMTCQICGHTYNLPTKTAIEEGFIRCPKCGYHTNATKGKEMIEIKEEPAKCDVCYYKYYLLNLLAVLHRDGGDYTNTHGISESVKDAMKIASNKVVE